MESLPVPCPASLVPDVTGQAAFNAAYRTARDQAVVFVAIERQGRRWTVRTDTLTAAPGHVTGDTAESAILGAVVRLARRGEIRMDSSAGPVYLALYGVEQEDRARDLAAAVHAALYGDLEPLEAAVPGES